MIATARGENVRKQVIIPMLVVSLLLGPGFDLVSDAPAQAPDDQPGTVKVAELSDKAERAIERGLRYLAKGQQTNGSFSTRYEVASTSLALMAFMLKGHFPRKGEYGQKLDKAVRYLLDRAKDGGGYLGKNMYEHGLATLALSEVWGMSDRPEIRGVLKRAVGVILRAQNSQGGWRYEPRPTSADVSVTVMQIVALASAKEAGIYVPKNVIDKAIKYVKSCQSKVEGGFGYSSPSNPAFARSAAGAMSLLITGQRDTREVRKALEYLQRLPDSKFKDEHFFYYGHYYAIQSMYQAGESYYQQWYPRIRDSLIARQGKDGGWGGAVDTGMAILVLGVPYRFLPIYQR